MKMIALPALVAFALAGCKTLPDTPAQTVYSLEGGYAAALSIAVAYRNLPLCDGSTPICHDKATLANIEAASSAVSMDLDLAEKAVRSGDSPSKVAAATNLAVAALEQLQALTSKVQTK